MGASADAPEVLRFYFTHYDKKRKAKAALEKGAISKEEYDTQVANLEGALENAPKEGRYRFD